MLLLEAADVVTGDGGQWSLGGEEIDRSCSLEVVLSEYCGADPDRGVIIEPSVDEAMPYRTLPFGIVGRFRRNSRCRQDDDEAWLRNQMEEVTERAVARALTSQSVFGTEAWIGADGVAEIPLPTGDETLADAVCAARTYWSEHNVGTPLLHVAPCAMLELASHMAVVIQDGSLWSIWGDKIVMSPGYDGGPPAFLTGPIAVRLSSIETVESLSVRSNKGVVEANRVGLLEIAPCSMVRIGPAPDGAPEPALPATFRIDVEGAHATAHIDGALQGASGTVDWGDGTFDSWQQTSDDPGSSPTLTHNYAPGTYTATLRPGGQQVPVTAEAPPSAQPTITVADRTVQIGGPAVEYTSRIQNTVGTSEQCVIHGTLSAPGITPDSVLTEYNTGGTNWAPVDCFQDGPDRIRYDFGSSGVTIGPDYDQTSTLRQSIPAGSVLQPETAQGRQWVDDTVNGVTLAEKTYTVTIEASSAAAPVVAAIQPTSGDAGTTATITGQNLGGS